MPNWQNFSFLVPRPGDIETFNRVSAAFQAADLQVALVDVNFLFGGPSFQGDPSIVIKQLSSLLGKDPSIATTQAMHFRFGPSNGATVSVLHSNSSQNNVQVQLEAFNQNQQDGNKVAPLIVGLKKHLKEMTEQLALDYLAPATQAHYKAREAALTSLESTLRSVSIDFADNIAKERQKLEEEYRARAERERNAIEKERAELDAAAAARKARLDAEEAALQKRLAEVDDRAARHVRRNIRDDIQKELKARAAKFELTQGTRDLRKPVLWFTLALLAVSGVAFFTTLVELYRILNGSHSTTDVIFLGVRQALFGATFGSTAVFLIRWTNRWFDRHATEEFRLKRLQLDLERASWVVEMALEWTKENSLKFPSTLVDRLATNLFLDAEAPAEKKTASAADHLASALLGSSAEVELSLPNGTKVKLDRKAIDRLKKATSVE